MRILVTNDDGVHAPGLGALVRAVARWVALEGHEMVVVAPLANHSGASAAVGTFYEREEVGFRAVDVEGAPDVEAYGLDAPPALTVVVGAYGAFGPRPDVVISGINLGVNVGRSILHSGTVGAALTAAQHGLRALAVSLRSQPDPHQWETAAELAVSVIPALAAAAPRTVLNLNVPTVPLAKVRGVVSGHISDAGIVRGATARMTGHNSGSVILELGAAVPSLGDTSGEGPLDDAALVGADYACLTALQGVGEDTRAQTGAVLEQALRAASERTRL